VLLRIATGLRSRPARWKKFDVGTCSRIGRIVTMSSLGAVAFQFIISSSPR